MKNIHILPTDRPSRLIHNDANQLCYQSNKSFKNDRKWMYRKKFNIYITNSEEIKEGDWCIDKHNFVYKQETDKIFSEFTGSKKIILTTDTDLIKDGVQTIDDEFLEWFVKNPSCDEVETYSLGIKNEETGESCHYEYEIIIPKEEQCTCKEHDPYCCQIHGNCPTCVKKEELKQENCCTPLGQIKRYEDCYGCDRKPKKEHHICKYCGAETTQSDDECYAKPKQEKLEEAAERLIKLNRQDAFYEGAKWQMDKQSDFIIGFLEFIEGTYSYSNIYDHWYLHSDTSKTYSKKQLLEVYLKRNKL